ERNIVLDQHAVVQDRQARRRFHFALLVETWPRENDVVSLPLTRRTRGVDQRRVLAVSRAGLAVGVSDVLIRIEHLHFVEAHEEHATVAPALTLALGRNRRGPLDVKLAIAKILQRANVAAAFHTFQA